MRSLPLARVAAATAAAAGVTLLGASLGGIARVDTGLAAAVAPVAQPQLVTTRVAWSPEHASRRAAWVADGDGICRGHERSAGRSIPEL
jgi:hypothetical protein